MGRTEFLTWNRLLGEPWLVEQKQNLPRERNGALRSARPGAPQKCLTAPTLLETPVAICGGRESKRCLLIRAKSIGASGSIRTGSRTGVQTNWSGRMGFEIRSVNAIGIERNPSTQLMLVVPSGEHYLSFLGLAGHSQLHKPSRALNWSLSRCIPPFAVRVHLVDAATGPFGWYLVERLDFGRHCCSRGRANR